MSALKKIIIFLVFAFLVQSSASAINNTNIEYAKNYLIILVHGIGDDHKCFKKVKAYLENNGLKGYVYGYEFSSPFLNIEKEGWEFGDRTYNNPEAVAKDSNNKSWREEWEITKRENNGKSGTGKSWLEQVREDFRIWKAKNYYNNDLSKVSDSEIPQKFIIIAHSMGGLAVRSYLYGKDHTGKRFYEGDIEKVIYIDTPHLGSTAGKAAIWASDNQPYRYLVPIVTLGLAGDPYLSSLNPQLANLFTANAAYALGGSALFDGSLMLMNRFKTPALSDMLPDSPFLNNINSANLGNYPPINQQIIVARGTPTPKNSSSIENYIYNLAVPARIMGALMTAATEPKLETWEQKMLSVNLTSVSGYPFYEDGDLVVTRSSQKGEGIDNLSNARIQEYQFRSRIIAEIESLASSLFLASYFVPWPANTFLVIGSLSFSASILATDEETRDMTLAHIVIKDKIVLNEGFLDKALFEESHPGAAGLTAINQTPFKLSSNLTNESGTIKTLSTYHEVSPEALNAAPAGYKLGTPIVIGGEEKYIESFTVKEPPTRITGVLRDFMPLKMQYFQYSENFAAWKDIKILDEWGNFQIDGLKLTEGQNVIAFQAKNKVGYESNQHLKIIVNTIPQVISSMFPLPNSFTNNNKTTISGEFNKSIYSTNTKIGEGIPTLTSAELYRNGKLLKDLLGDSDFKLEHIKVNDYNTKVKFAYSPQSPLLDGKYEIHVKAKSEVGTSQGNWMFWVDTKPPEIQIKFSSAWGEVSC